MAPTAAWFGIFGVLLRIPTQEAAPPMREAPHELFATVRELRISHGELKATHFPRHGDRMAPVAPDAPT